MHIVIREGDLMVEIRAHANEQPRVCAWRAGQDVDDQSHLTAQFTWAEHFVLDDLRTAVRLVLDGIRPQLETGVTSGN